MLFIWFLYITLLTFEVLNYLNLFRENVIYVLIMISITTLFFHYIIKIRKHFKNGNHDIINNLRENLKPLLPIAILTLLKIYEGYYIAQNNWDSMSYHLPRYLHWLQNESLEFYFTTIQRQNISPVLPDYLFSITYIIFGNDKFIFLVNIISVTTASYYIYKIILLLTSNKHKAILGLFISFLLPSQIAFMSSSQTDPISTALITILLYFALSIESNQDRKYIYLIIFMIPLLITTKTTGLILSIPIYVYVFVKHAEKISVNYKKYILVFILATLPAIPYISRILKSNSINDAGVFVSDFSILGLLTNSCRIIINVLQTPIPAINRYIELLYYWFAHNLHIDPNPAGYSDYGIFRLSTSLHADLTGNPLHLLLLIYAAISLWIANKQRQIIYLIFFQFLILGLTIGWQPWINRFTSSILIVGSILIGLWLGDKRKLLQWTVLIIVFAYSTFWIFYNPSRSLLNPKPFIVIAEKMGLSDSDLIKIRHDLKVPRELQYFSIRPSLEESYFSALKLINHSVNTHLFIKIDGNDYEYPIWALTDFEVKIDHFEELDKGEIISGNAFLFCTVDCKRYNLEKLYLDNNVSLWRYR